MMRGRFASDDVGVLYDPASGAPCWPAAVTARDMISQVIVDAPRRASMRASRSTAIASRPARRAGPSASSSTSPATRMTNSRDTATRSQR